MTTVEKLLVEIFERKNSIIEQVKQQTELYNQHLASKLLIHGVTPPPWLWNPNPSSHTTKLNKEELISELLLPHPRRPFRYSSARYSLYSKPVVTDYPEVSDGYYTENHASNRALDVEEGPSTIVECREIDGGNNLNSVPELDDSVSSPVDQIDARISNICSAPDHSLARIQRSKSRQKALELRNSAKSKAKSHLRNEENSGRSPCGIKLSGLDSEWVDHINEAPKLPEPCAIGRQICGDNEKSEEDSQILGKGSNVNAERVTRSKSSGKSCSNKESSDRDFETEEKGYDVLMGSSKKVKSAPEIIGDIESSEGDSRTKGKFEDIDARGTTRSRSSGISLKDWESNEGDSQIEDKENDPQAGRITTPMSSAKRASHARDSLTVNSSGDIVPEKDVIDSTSVIVQINDVSQICFKGNDSQAGKITTPRSSGKRASHVHDPLTVNSSGDIVPETDVIDSTSVIAQRNDVSQICSKGNDPQAGRITTPRSSTKQPSHVRDSLTVNSSGDIVPKTDVIDSTSVIAQRNDVSQICSMDDVTQQLCCASGSLELIDPHKASHEVCNVEEAGFEEGCARKDESPNNNCDPIRRSNSSSRQHDSVNKASESNIDSSFAKMDGGFVGESGEKIVQSLDNGNKSSVEVRISGGSFRKRRRSQNTSGNEQTSNPAENFSSSGLRCTRFKLSAAEQIDVANNEHQNASDGQMIPDTTDKFEQQENGDTVVANKLETEKVVEDRSFSYRTDCLDTNLRKGLECLAARPPSDCFMLVKPKQLDFDDTEDLNETLSLTVERKRLEKSARKVCSILLEAASSSDTNSSGNNIITPTKEKSSITPEVSSEMGGSGRKSSKSNSAGDIRLQMTRDGPSIDEHSELKSINNDPELACRQSSPHMHKDDFVPPKAIETPDIEITNVNSPSKQGCESSLELHTEGGECSCEGENRSATSSYASKCKHSLPTHFSSFTKEAAGDSQLSLSKEVGYRDSTRIELDASTQYYVDDNLKLSLSGTEGLPLHVDSMSLSNEIMGGNSHLGMNGSVGVVNDRSLDVLKPTAFRITDTSSQCYKVKRRKTETQQVNCSTVSPSFKSQNLIRTPMDTYIRDVKDVWCSADTVLVEAATGNKISDGGMDSNMKHHQTKSIESLPEHQRNEDGIFSPENKENPETLFPFTHKTSGVSFVSKLTEEAAGDTQEGCLVEAMETEDPTCITFDVRNLRDEQISNLENRDALLNSDNLDTLKRKSCSEEDDLLLTNSVQPPRDKDLKLFDDDQTVPEELVCAQGNLLERKYILEENDLVSCSVQSPHIEDPDPMDADQTMPVLEGFIIDSQSENEELSVCGGMLNIDKLDLPQSTIARASILEQICKSASACTPLSHLQSGSKLHRYENLFQSIPNCLLEQTDLQGVHFLNEDVDKQFSASFSNVNEANFGLQRMSYSDYLPSSANRFGFTPGNQYTSPLGKIWESFSSQSGSSGKRLSSNPELTCFRIEEDPSVSEGNETTDEGGNKIQEDIDPLEVNSAPRDPQTNITKVCLDPPASVSAAKKYLTRGSVDPISTEASFSRTHNKVKRKLGNSYRNMGEGKENQTLSLGVNGIKMAKESLNNRFSKPKLSGKTSLRNERCKLSENEPQRSNIVSNVTSFIPLVQQKQAAAVCTGKRDVKVKALEAAEAVKRQEEKRENERKLRKEALKLERARMEQENAKQAELNKKKKEEEKKKKEEEDKKKKEEEKKKKEEEKKKKDADMAARKRMREEEGRREKETKRKRIEETRRQQKEQEEKLHTEKLDKEKQQSNIDVKMNSKKEYNIEKKHQNMGKERGDDATMKKLDMEPSTAVVLTTNLQQANISLKEFSASADSCINKQAIGTLDKSSDTSDVVREITQEKSYEISPYQCSDDEDDDVEDLPTKKFIPSWASKTSVALALPLQQEIDPDIIFPVESFCSMDEVLLPRNLQQK